MEIFVVVRNQHSSTCCSAAFREREQAEARVNELRQEWRRVQDAIEARRVADPAVWIGADWDPDDPERVMLYRIRPLHREKLESFPSHLGRLDRAHARKALPLEKDLSWRVEAVEVIDWFPEGGGA